MNGRGWLVGWLWIYPRKMATFKGKWLGKYSRPMDPMGMLGGCQLLVSGWLLLAVIS